MTWAAIPALNTSNSDNLLLVHLDPAHTHAIVLSIPRDTMVYEPGCQARRSVGSGIIGPYQSAIIDGAMNIGGPSCAVSTVSDLTGITLDHFVMFNFNSFRAMVDTIGGVEVCVPRSGYHDPYSGLNLSGGKHLLTYNQALAYVRTRHGVQAEGDVGGDLPRIELQQAFISSAIQKVNSQGVLSNSVQLLKIADVATRALTVDQGLDSASKLLGLARSLTGLHANNVTLLTMPTMTDPANVNRLLPAAAGRRCHLPDDPRRPGVASPAAHAAGQPGAGAGAERHRHPAAWPGGPPGELTRLGFDVTGTGDAAAASATTVTYSGTAQADSAYTLTTALKATAGRTEPAGRAGPADRPAGPGHADHRQRLHGREGARRAALCRPERPARGHRAGQAGRAAASGSPAARTTVQSRNAGASICSGLPAANPDPGTPGG